MQEYFSNWRISTTKVGIEVSQNVKMLRSVYKVLSKILSNPLFQRIPARRSDLG
jgi:hypothetical protein